ncbi:MAG: hypothetical protein EBZ48_07480 [Proteobacteria bacterium]|nr:hypothetical protein [Pseudomonadota bacterium]
MLRQRSGDFNPQVIAGRRELALLHTIGPTPIRAEALSEQNIRELELEAAKGTVPREFLARAYLDAAACRAVSCKYSETEELLGQAESAGIGNVPHLYREALILRANLMAIRQEHEQSLSLLDQALRISDPADPDGDARARISLWQQMAAMLLQQHRSEEASMCLDRSDGLLGSIPAVPFSTMKAQSLRLRGKVADARGDSESSGFLYASALEEIRREALIRGTIKEVPYLLSVAGWQAQNGDAGNARALLVAARQMLLDGGQSSHQLMLPRSGRSMSALRALARCGRCMQT